MVFLLNHFILSKIDIKNENQVIRKDGFFKNLLRGIIVAAIVMTVASLAGILGEKWGGILSSFPSTLFPLLLILHFEYGNLYYPNVVKGFSQGIIVLLFFYVGFYFLLPIIGLNETFLAVYFFSIVILAAIFLIKKLFIIQKKKKNVIP